MNGGRVRAHGGIGARNFERIGRAGVVCAAFNVSKSKFCDVQTSKLKVSVIQ
jgi:hypothetical protein